MLWSSDLTRSIWVAQGNLEGLGRTSQEEVASQLPVFCVGSFIKGIIRKRVPVLKFEWHFLSLRKSSSRVRKRLSKYHAVSKWQSWDWKLGLWDRALQSHSITLCHRSTSQGTASWYLVYELEDCNNQCFIESSLCAGHYAENFIAIKFFWVTLIQGYFFHRFF